MNNKKIGIIICIMIFLTITPLSRQIPVSANTPPNIKPCAIDINTLTNQIYVANYNSGTVTVIDGNANIVEATIEVGRNPEDIAIYSKENKVYISHYYDDSISVIDISNNVVIKRIKVRDKPIGIAINDVSNKLYVANRGDNSISIIDLTLDKIITNISVGGSPNDIVINTFSNRIYVVNSADDTISVIDGNNDNVIATVSVGKNAENIAVDTTLNKVYVTTSYGINIINGDTNQLTLMLPYHPFDIAVNQKTNLIYATGTTLYGLLVIDGQSNSLLTSIPYGTSDSGDGVAVNPLIGNVYVTMPQSDRVLVADINKHIRLGIIPIGEDDSGHLESSILLHTDDIPLYPSNANCVTPQAISFNPKTNNIYVACYDSNNVAVIDCSQKKVITTIGVEEGPNDITIDSAANLIYVSNWFSRAISVINGDTNNVIAHYSFENPPKAIDVNPNTEKLYVATSYDIVYVFDINSREKLTEITVGNSPRDVAVNSVTNKIYVTNSIDDNVSVIDGDSNKVVGSFGSFSFGASAKLAVDQIQNRIYVADTQGITIVDGNTNKIVKEISIDWFSPEDIIVQPETNMVYLTNSGIDSKFMVIDGETLELIESSSPFTYAHGSLCMALDYPSNYIYITNSMDNTVTILDSEDYELVKKIPIGSKPYDIAVNWNTNKIYVVNKDTDIVSVIDSNKNMVTKNIEVGIDPVCIELDINNNIIYVAASSSLYIIDGEEDKVIDTVEFSGKPEGGIAFNPSTHLLYITTDLGDGVTLVIDTQTNTIIENKGITLNRGIAINPVTNKIYAESAVNYGGSPVEGFIYYHPWGYKVEYMIGEYVPGYLMGAVAVYDGATSNLTKINDIVYSIDAPRNRIPLVVDSIRNKIFAAPNVVWRKEGKVIVIDGDNDTIVSGIYAEGVYGMDFKDIAIDESNCWVYTLLKDDYVLLIDGINESVISDVPLSPYSDVERIALNPVSKIAYTANPGSGTISLIKLEECQPVAFFDYYPEIPKISEDITFNGSLSYSPCGLDITSYNWDFGDNSKSTDQNPQHKFSSIEEYIVTLEITDINGNIDLFSETINFIEDTDKTEETTDDTNITDEEEITNGHNVEDRSTPGFTTVAFIISAGVGALVVFFRRRNRDGEI